MHVLGVKQFRTVRSDCPWTRTFTPQVYPLGGPVMFDSLLKRTVCLMYMRAMTLALGETGPTTGG